jgi:hypothetical protein
MSPSELLAELYREGFVIGVRDGRLLISPMDRLTEEKLRLLKQYKSLLVARLLDPPSADANDSVERLAEIVAELTGTMERRFSAIEKPLIAIANFLEDLSEGEPFYDVANAIRELAASLPTVPRAPKPPPPRPWSHDELLNHRFYSNEES